VRAGFRITCKHCICISRICGRGKATQLARAETRHVRVAQP
jgi:hypothetical protein